MTIRFNHLNESLDIVEILDPGCEFFSAKCIQKTFFPLEMLSFTFEKNLIKI